MQKKRIKSTKGGSKRDAKKTSKTAGKSSEKKPDFTSALKDLEIVSGQQVEQKLENIGSMQHEIQKEENKIINEEKKLEEKTGKVEELEKEIKKEITTKPLKKLSIKDLNKGIIGAFIGVVAHFGFIYGKEIAEQISTARATVLFAFSYIMIIILMYETGYREIKEKKILGFLPRRATIIYLTSLAVIVVILLMFNLVSFSDPLGLYKVIAVISVLASVGAGTADLIGKG